MILVNYVNNCDKHVLVVVPVILLVCIHKYQVVAAQEKKYFWVLNTTH